MSDLTTTSPDTSDNIADIRYKFKSETEKNQQKLIPEVLSSGDVGLQLLMEFLWERRSSAPSLVDGIAYQALYQANSAKATEFLNTNFPTGVVPLKSERGIDYSPLQKLLAQQDFEDADRLSNLKLCELAGSDALQRKWLYFTEVENFPITDLQTINNLWLLHSEGKFGFSVQREIWLAVGKNWEKLWSKIGWKNGNAWTRYPNEFTWDLTAPKGHLPLSNQLRGVRVISSLLSHPAWTIKN
ncbi:MAG TPA: GUN4 N-terminal ARM-like repeat domain-containing protein [Candidatus Sericytochromatia bacterium]